MHKHYLLKLIASLARVRKSRCILLYSCENFVLYLMGIISAYGHEVLFICHGYYTLKLANLNYLKSLTSHSVLNFSQ